MPVTIEDVLARRTRSLLLNAKASSEASSLIASIMAEELKLDHYWQKEQIDSYNSLAEKYL
jgi:glycerol-3-phosphate dehydrogenase